MNTTTATLNKAAWVTQHSILWGDLDWHDVVDENGEKVPSPTDPQMAISWGPKFATRCVPLGDADAAWEFISQNALEHETYMAVHPVGAALTGTSRGATADRFGVSCVLLDIDGDWGKHSVKGDAPLPSRAQADQIIAALPLAPALVVESGGGLHVYLRLDRVYSSTAAQPVMDGLKFWYEAQAATMKIQDDAGPTADLARVLRPAGSLNHKLSPSRPVTIEHQDPLCTWTLRELRDAFPAPAPVVTATPIPMRAEGDAERASDRFAVAVPVSKLLVDVFGFHIIDTFEKEGTLAGYSLGRTFSPSDDPKHSRIKTYNTNPERGETATLNSEIRPGWPSLRDARSITGKPKSDAFTSWDCLVYVICGGDFKTAAQILRAFPATDGGHSELVEAIKELIVIEPKALDVDATNLIEASRVAAAQLTADDARGPGSIWTEGRVRVVNDPTNRDHGIAVSVWVNGTGGEEGYWEWDQITNWVPSRPRVTMEMRTLASGLIEKADGDAMKRKTYDLEIVRKDGRVFRESGLSSEDSLRKKGLDVLDSGVTMPSQASMFHVENVLRSYRSDSKEEEFTYSAAGWTLTRSGVWSYLGPRGSITRDGINHDFEVGPLAGSEKGALTESQRAFGFTRLPRTLERRRELAPSLKAYLDVVPNKKHIPIAIMGALFAAPLNLTTRTTVFVEGQPEAGKTAVAVAGLRAVSNASAKNAPTGTFRKATAFGVEKAMEWARHSVCLIDDYKQDVTSGASAENAKRVAALDSVSRAGYGAPGGLKGTASGGTRKANTASTVNIVTGEEKPAAEESLRQRMVLTELQAGDVDFDRETGALNRFLNTYGTIEGPERSSLMNEFYGDYILWIAENLATGTAALADLQAKSDLLMEDMMAALNGNNRDVETVAVLATGWASAALWAEARGFADLMPDQSVLAEAYQTLIEGNRYAATQATSDQLLLETLQGMIDMHIGHLVGSDLAQPNSNVAMRAGWSRETGHHGEYIYRPRGERLGIISADGEDVIIFNESMRKARERANIAGLSKVKQDQALEPHIRKGTRPGEFLSAKSYPGLPRTRAYVFPAELFGLGGGPDKKVLDDSF